MLSHNRLARDDRVPDADLAVGDDVGPQAAAVDEGAQRAGRKALEVGARLAQALPEALDAG